MKIYHTETQADYDALMLELEGKGFKWSFGRKLTEVNRWHVYEHLTCLRVYDSKVNHASLNYYKEEYPDITITKYKAKVDEKMRFTKENVEKVLDEYFWQADLEPCGDLIAEIYSLDDKPKKVGVPKFVADWIERNKKSEVSLQIMLNCHQNYYYNMNRKCQTDEEKAVQWYVDNPYKFIQAYEEGYTIEPEKLYYIPLPHLETSDGIQQVLSQRENRMNYFASTPHKILKQRFTKEELAQVPEIYKPFAKLIEEEDND